MIRPSLSQQWLDKQVCQIRMLEDENVVDLQKPGNNLLTTLKNGKFQKTSPDRNPWREAMRATSPTHRRSST